MYVVDHETERQYRHLILLYGNGDYCIIYKVVGNVIKDIESVYGSLVNVVACSLFVSPCFHDMCFYIKISESIQIDDKKKKNLQI